MCAATSSLQSPTPQHKSATRPEPLHSISVLEAYGYGSRRWLLDQINAGKIPAVKVGKSYKVRDSDLHLLAQPVEAAR